MSQWLLGWWRTCWWVGGLWSMGCWSTCWWVGSRWIGVGHIDGSVVGGPWFCNTPEFTWEFSKALRGKRRRSKCSNFYVTKNLRSICFYVLNRLKLIQSWFKNRSICVLLFIAVSSTIFFFNPFANNIPPIEKQGNWFAPAKYLINPYKKDFLDEDIGQ